MKTPVHAIVRWRDATGKPGNVKPTRLTKNLPVKETIGWLFKDGEGTLAIVQERLVGKRGLDGHGEFTLVPAAWVVEIIPLYVSESPLASASLAVTQGKEFDSPGHPNDAAGPG